MTKVMHPAPFPQTPQAQFRTLRMGSVSFLNAKPLIYGLEQDRHLSLRLAVPSKLLSGLERELFDVALLPVIDYQRLDGLRVVPVGGIGCDGPTLTVRIFSKVPIERIRTMACDTDSHTSVALARVILAERYQAAPEFADLRHEEQVVDAKLLIGDKVVCEEPAGFEHQLDLGQAWRELTGLPFVFAIWTVRGGVDLHDLPQRLKQAREQGMQHIDQILERFAVSHGWPIELARQYLTSYLNFEIGPRQLEAISHFYQLCARHGIIPGPPRVLQVYGSDSD